MCLFTDASDTHWSIILTQAPKGSLCTSKLEVHDLPHETLAFISGAFHSSELKRSTLEKEAYPIILALTRLRHFLLNGFRILCDHRNLSYIFSPFKERKQTREKLARCCDHLLSFNNLIEHISGIDNIWDDLMTRWGSSSECLNSIVRSQ